MVPALLFLEDASIMLSLLRLSSIAFHQKPSGAYGL